MAEESYCGGYTAAAFALAYHLVLLANAVFFIVGVVANQDGWDYWGEWLDVTSYWSRTYWAVTWNFAAAVVVPIVQLILLVIVMGSKSRCVGNTIIALCALKMGGIVTSAVLGQVFAPALWHSSMAYFLWIQQGLHLAMQTVTIVAVSCLTEREPEHAYALVPQGAPVGQLYPQLPQCTTPYTQQPVAMAPQQPVYYQSTQHPQVRPTYYQQPRPTYYTQV